MPIRTNRGRSAVYRRLWGWPLRSPKHLIAFAIVLIAVGVLVATLIPVIAQSTGNAQPGATSSSEQQPTQGGSSGATTTPTTTETRLTAPLSTATSAPPAPQALTTATNFAKAWANHPNGISKQQWLAGLKPYTTDEYLPQLESIDLANIPANKVTGQPVAKESTTSSVIAEVPTDGGTLRISVISTPSQGWRVSHYDKAS
ncbi:hypothetical protein GCM10010174_20870 [Kutzneria viridogrisea]|uniref:Cytoskeletal protein RodZ n=1 Tax=Kutzneria viridogrisea TaxID=47990 RepID=A0ABR6BTW5_9PSEU|nr:cytoskeletal protein RodZ [Kutzneria viridogrisea]